MKNKFIKPLIDVIEISNDDIICTSGPGPTEQSGSYGDPDGGQDIDW